MEVADLFETQGYICERTFLDAKELSALQQNLELFVDNELPAMDSKLVFYEDIEDKSSLKQIQHLEEHSNFFNELGRSKKFTDLAEKCLGGQVNLINVQYFNKSPGKNEPTPAHQDGYYFMIKPQAAVTMWLSLGYADAENGAVCYIPKSHRMMRPHGRTQTLGFSQGITDWSESDSNNEIQMTARPGDLLAHHALTIHRAGRNESQRSRKSIGFIYYRSDVEIDEAAHIAYQQNLAIEMTEKGRL